MTKREELAYLRDQIQLERDELAKRRHASERWSEVADLLAELGCHFGDGQHVKTEIRDWLESVIAKQPE